MSGGAHTPLVSVVIPFRDGAAYLPGLFAALDAQTLPPESFEVLLVDDGSTDEGPELAGDWVAAAPERRRIVGGPGTGPASARNAGIRAARGIWVASTDCDIEPHPGWLAAALETLEHTGAEAVEGPIDVRAGHAEGIYAVEQENSTGGRYMTGNMVYRRELLERLGGFDERFEAQFLEDSDLAFRILDEGHEIPFAASARVTHPVVGRSAVEVLRATSRTQWLALFAAKHPERYRRELRPLVRPLTAIDVDVLVALAAAAAIPRSRGLARAALTLAAANGLKRGLVTAQVHTAPDPEQAARRAGLALAVPPLRAFWWLVGCIRFRKVTL